MEIPDKLQQHWNVNASVSMTSKQNKAKMEEFDCLNGLQWQQFFKGKYH